MLVKRAMRVGVVYWQQSDELAVRISGALEYLGYEAIDFLSTAKLPRELDAVFAYGPFGSLAPLANQLSEIPPAHRPPFAFLMTEQLPNPDLPEWLRYGFGRLRSQAERVAFRRQADGTWQITPWLRWLTTRAYRFRYYGDLYWLQRQGILSVLAVSSLWVADFLRARGFNPIVPPPSYYPDWGADLKLERDIPVVWLGKIATARRGRLLKRVRAELKQRGVEILMIDGIENPYVFGKERTILLNRTKVVLNLLREKWDDNSLRFTLATYNGALIITEPTLPHTPFLPGVHLVEVPIEQIADTICYYLSHEEARRQIVNQAYQLLTQDSTIGKGFAEILEQVELARRRTISEM
jgi:hypothetical protein